MTEGSSPSRGFQAFDVVIVVALAVSLTLVAGVAWSVVRDGSVAWVYVREAQFLLAILVFLVWTVRNWSGHRGREDDLDPDPTVPVPDPSKRVGLYQRLTGDDSADAGDALPVDAYLFATGVVLLCLSAGVELLLPNGV